MSVLGFDISQFYTRRNSNYSVNSESDNAGQPLDTTSKVDSLSDDGGATCMPIVESEKKASEICGFLFSISRDENGEYWPVRMGNNTIGNSEQCDIVLRQNSVIESHATLCVEDSQGKLAMKVNGEGKVFVNGLEITSSTPCRDRDILTIGNTYQLLLLFVDRGKYGLCKAENFEEKSEQEDESVTIDVAQPEEGTVFIQE